MDHLPVEAQVQADMKTEKAEEILKKMKKRDRKVSRPYQGHLISILSCRKRQRGLVRRSWTSSISPRWMM